MSQSVRCHLYTWKQVAYWILEKNTYCSCIVQIDLFGRKGSLPNDKLIKGRGDVLPVGVAVSCSDHQICVRVAVIVRHITLRVADTECAIYVDLQAIFKGPRE